MPELPNGPSFTDCPSELNSLLIISMSASCELRFPGQPPRQWEGRQIAPPSLNAHQQAGWQDIGTCWHPPEASVYSDKITGRAMGWWGHGGTLYLGVKTLTNLPLRLRSSERSKCTRVCQRCNQRVDLGPWQWVWHNECRKCHIHFFSQRWKFCFSYRQFNTSIINVGHNRTTVSLTIWTWESIEHRCHQGPVAFLFKPTAVLGKYLIKSIITQLHIGSGCRFLALFVTVYPEKDFPLLKNILSQFLNHDSCIIPEKKIMKMSIKVYLPFIQIYATIQGVLACSVLWKSILVLFV